MGKKLVSDSLPNNNQESGSITSTLFKTYTECFYEHFPYYLSIGMTFSQYWEEDSTLTIYYRKAQEYITKRKNEEMYLQGRYIYDALLAVSPIMHAFAKAGTTAHPYLKYPYPLTQKEAEALKKREEYEKFLKMKQIMISRVNKTNKK